MPARITATMATLSLILAPAAIADPTGATGATGTAGSVSTLTVDGNGTVFVAPDVAGLSITVSQRAPQSRAALSADNAQIDAIVAAIRALGVPASGVQTESVDVSKGSIRVGPKGHKHRVTQYTASDTIDITTTPALVGQVVDAATAKGADSIDGPNFSFSNPSAGLVQANNAALADARQQADAAAATLGYTVTGVQSVNLDPEGDDSSGGSSAAGVSAAAAPKASTPTTVHPGTQEVDATVEVVFTIAPAPAT